MFGRVSLSIVIAWAVLLGPALCAGGVLAHECSSCPQPQSCHHEPGCGEDPCTTILAPRHDPSPTLPAPAATTPPPPAAVVVPTEAPAAGILPDRIKPPSAARPSRYFDSSLPLLN